MNTMTRSYWQGSENSNWINNPCYASRDSGGWSEQGALPLHNRQARRNDTPLCLLRRGMEQRLMSAIVTALLKVHNGMSSNRNHHMEQVEEGCVQGLHRSPGITLTFLTILLKRESTFNISCCTSKTTKQCTYTYNNAFTSMHARLNYT